MSFKSILLSAIAVTSFALPAWAEIEFHDQYARSSNPVAGAAFMVIHNHGDTDDRLLGVRSDAAARVELHTHIEDADGVMRMTHLEDGFDLPAGGEIKMVRGAEHVMFMGLDSPMEQGDTLTVTFEFEQAGDVIVEIPVDQEHEENHGDADGGHDGHDAHDDHDHSGHDH